VERRHVTVVEGHVRKALAGDGEERFVEVEPSHVRIAIAQLRQVLAGAAGDVEERARIGPALTDQVVEPPCLPGVVLEAVDEVVEIGRAVEDARTFAPPVCCGGRTIRAWRSILASTSVTSI
jgi:hypothetical protein